MLICAVKIAEQIVGKSIYKGMCLFINSNAPTGQRLGMSLALVTALVLAMIVDKPDNINTDNMISGNTHTGDKGLEVSLPLSHEALIDLILSKYQIIRDQSTYKYKDLQMSMLAYFRNKWGCLFVETGEATQSNETEINENTFEPKEITKRPGIVYMETVSGSSKIKENLIRVKSLLEYKLFLYAIGVHNPEGKKIRLHNVCQTYGYSAEDLRRLLEESFDNRAYTKKEIEETMKLDLFSLVSDVPYASQSMDSIFSLNPYT